MKKNSWAITLFIFVISPVVFADGVNEMGFGAAVLYFPGYAQYDSPDPEDSSRPAVTALELTGFLLGLSASVEEAASILRTIRIVGAEDSITGTVAPLHWLVADRTGKSMVIEKTADGLHLMDNPVGVLSNSPELPVAPDQSAQLHESLLHTRAATDLGQPGADPLRTGRRQLWPAR